MKLRIMPIILLLALLLTISGCKQEEEKVSYDGRIYDISLNQDSSVTATTVKVGNNYELTISGSGMMKDFEKSSSVPWNPVVKLINKVTIMPDVTNLGDYALYAVNQSEYFLSTSISSIEEHTFKSDTVLYSYKTTLDSVRMNNATNKIYYYSETAPSVYGVYFHLVDGSVMVWNKYKVLFVGNSFTYYPASEANPKVPALFLDLANDLGVNVEVDFVVKGSHTLTKFVNPSDAYGSVVHEKLNNNQYTHIILQEQSTTPIDNYNAFNKAVGDFVALVASTQTDCEIRLYETWGSPTAVSNSSKYNTVGEMEQALRDAYTKCADAYNLKVHYVGKAFTYVFENYQEINLYYSDNRHQGLNGAYLSACVHLINIAGVDVRRSTVFDSLEQNIAQTLQQVAMYIVNDSPIEVPTVEEPVEEEDPILVIAWYGKTQTSGLTNTIMNNWLSSLKSYLISQGYSQSEVNLIKLRAYDGNVATSCGAIKNDNDVDVMVGWKSNVDSLGELSFLEAYPGLDGEGNSLPGITMGEASDRWIHRLTDKELSILVFNWLKTEDGNQSLR